MSNDDVVATRRWLDTNDYDGDNNDDGKVMMNQTSMYELSSSSRSSS